MEISENTIGAFLTKSKLTRIVLPFLAIATVCYALYFIFMVVPNERIMGAVQRIFYFHVASAFISYLMIAVLFVGSVLYLVKKKNYFDLLAASAAEIAFLLCTIVLISGMIWGNAAWNTWWRWEPRLVSFLVLWLILLSYLLLRAFTESHQQQKIFSAVLGILSAINVPIVIYSIKLLEQTEQLHPEVVAKQGLQDSSFIYGLLYSTIALFFLGLWLLVVSLQVKLAENFK